MLKAIFLQALGQLLLKSSAIQHYSCSARKINRGLPWKENFALRHQTAINWQWAFQHTFASNEKEGKKERKKQRNKYIKYGNQAGFQTKTSPQRKRYIRGQWFNAQRTPTFTSPSQLTEAQWWRVRPAGRVRQSQLTTFALISQNTPFNMFNQ